MKYLLDRFVHLKRTVACRPANVSVRFRCFITSTKLKEYLTLNNVSRSVGVEY